MGRALAMDPDLLLLDEPASGLTPAEVQQLAQKILKLRQDGITLFIIEHRFEIVMEIADEIAVLHNGKLIAEGSPDEVRENKKVIEAYLKSRGIHA
jgi:ABC-type branched-subunit amino acid transport system ATPase component